MSEARDLARSAAARYAVEKLVRPGLRLALGTGSTAAHAVRALRARFPHDPFDCVASSVATATLARSVGLEVRELRGDDRFDLMLDGADEVAPNLDLTKGGGGALLREKLLARLSDRVVILVDDSKLVPALGTRHPIPVEVVPFARPVLQVELTTAGLRPELRVDPTGRGVTTDNGNEILDLRPETPVADPGALHASLKGRVGVVETGIFVGLAERVVVGEPSGAVREMTPSNRRGR